MKKCSILLTVLSFALLFTLIALPVTAAGIELYENSHIVTSAIIGLDELPEDGTPVTVMYSLNEDNRTENSDYIVFQMTRSSVTWNCVGVPSDQIFLGSMSIMNITTGMSCGSNISMVGRSDIVPYIGLSGHSYHMYFSGSLWRTDSSGKITEKVSNESGGWTWTVPIS